MKQLIPEPGLSFFPGMNRFPADFIAAEGIDRVVGWFLAGLVLTAIVKPART